MQKLQALDWALESKELAQRASKMNHGVERNELMSQAVEMRRQAIDADHELECVGGFHAVWADVYQTAAEADDDIVHGENIMYQLTGDDEPMEDTLFAARTGMHDLHIRADDYRMRIEYALEDIAHFDATNAHVVLETAARAMSNIASIEELVADIEHMIDSIED